MTAFTPEQEARIREIVAGHIRHDVEAKRVRTADRRRGRQ